MLQKNTFEGKGKPNFEKPLTVLVWLTSIVSIILTFVVSKYMIPVLFGSTDLWWQLSLIISCGTLAGALIPEFIKVFTSTQSMHVKEVVNASREGGASLNVLSGLVAGNFSAFWMGLVFIGLMGGGYAVSTWFPDGMMMAPAVFAFGLIAFGFLGMGPVTIAVDSYGPVTDNAQSVYELSMIEQLPGADLQLGTLLALLQDDAKNQSSWLTWREGRPQAEVAAILRRDFLCSAERADKLSGAWGRHPLLGRMYLPAYRAGTEKVAELRRRHPPERIIPALYNVGGLVDLVTIDQVLAG
jgi:hypothetical protein